ncbi:uncharacterized protein LOC107648312 [Arachis ipaensis]|uniref:uncharacterized protein LOC107648312 n=1 Tax=Arachis ipaensis TaxID=130454 RepID=UPI000A2B2A46|nr:uncharacterized protein LOC107648312 [Arachis ipaensis]
MGVPWSRKLMWDETMLLTVSIMITILASTSLNYFSVSSCCLRIRDLRSLCFSMRAWRPSSIGGGGRERSLFDGRVIDALVNLFYCSIISAETLWDGGWLLRQLFSYSESEFNNNYLELLKVSYNSCASALMEEARGIWSDFLVTVLCEEWRKCKRAMESSSPRKEWTCMLLPPHKLSSEVDVPDESSFVAGERMLELVKVFVLQHQLQIFALGKPLPEQPPIHLPGDLPVNHRAKTCGLDVSGPKPGIELSLGNLSETAILYSFH